VANGILDYKEVVRMKHDIISIGNAKLHTYIIEDGEFSRKNHKREAMMICPGGGYTIISENEGEPVATFFNGQGFHAFVLEYSVKIENPFPVALIELAQAMDYVKKHADAWHLDKNKLSVIGFSAGGNLALSLGAYIKDKIITSDIGLTTKDIEPYKICLGYPTITLRSKRDGMPMPQSVLDLIEQGLMPDFRGPSVYEIQLGKINPSDDEIEQLNLLNKVNEYMPPVFIFGTYEDPVIPVSDLTDLAKKLSELKVECELHLFSKGTHGMSVANTSIFEYNEIRDLSLSMWTELAMKWLRQK